MTLPDVAPERSGNAAGPTRGGWLALVLAASAAVLALVGGRMAPADEVGPFGIISALPTVYWVGFGLGLVATGLLLRRAVVDRTRYAGAVPALWLLILHTAPHLAHRHFRFPTVWVHLGFVRLIEEQQTGDVLVDARFAWPGYFGTFAASLGRADSALVETAMRLWPTAILGATGILVAALANRAYPTVPFIGPLAAVCYVALSWTGQDYFSPQSFGYLVYLCLLVLLESGPLRAAPAWSASVPLVSRFSAAGGDRPVARTAPVFVALVVLSFGAVVSHPLAPFFICTGLVILGLYGRTVAWRLLLIVGSVYLVWFLVTAQPWYSTQLDELVGQVGDFFSNFRATTSGRVTTASPEHLLVTRVRSLIGVGTFVATLVVGVAMATERYRHLRPAIPLAPLAGIPSVALALQSYGGEIIFRILLFTLPMASILMARALVSVRLRALPFALPLLIALVAPLLLVARFGNELFEMSTAEDRAAVEAAYQRADDDVLFVVDSGFLPMGDRSVGSTVTIEIPAQDDQSYLTAIDRAAQEQNKDRVIVVFTTSQAAWRVHGLDSTADHLDVVAEWLIDQPGTTLIHRGDGSWVLEL